MWETCLPDDLNFNNLIGGTRKDEQWNNILKSCVLARISTPSSKRKTVKNLSLDYALDIPLEKVYRMMDHVSKREEYLKKNSNRINPGIVQGKSGCFVLRCNDSLF